jgi:hypothetical protein
VTKSEETEEDTEVLGAYFAVEGVGLRLYNHTLRETYDPHSYSVTYSGKTVQTLSSTVLMYFGADYYNIAAWIEWHEYRWTGGSSGWVGMAACEGMVPPNTGCKDCNTVRWCKPDSLEGIGKCVLLLWDYGGGYTPGIITNAEVDTSMPE